MKFYYLQDWQEGFSNNNDTNVKINFAALLLWHSGFSDFKCWIKFSFWMALPKKGLNHCPSCGVTRSFFLYWIDQGAVLRGWVSTYLLIEGWEIWSLSKHSPLTNSIKHPCYYQACYCYHFCHRWCITPRHQKKVFLVVNKAKLVP